MPIAHYPETADFLDSDGERCQVTQAVDGTLRCARLSPGAYESARWADAACTQRLYTGDLPAAEAARMRAAFRATDGTPTALATVKVYDGPRYQKDLDVRSPVDDGGFTLLQLGQRIDATTLPLVVETTF